MRREGGDCLENAGYGRSMGRAADTLWLLAHVWENLAPAAPAASPHVIGSLINDIAIHAGGGGGGGEGEGKEDRLVPSELLVLTQLIMATMNMKRWVEHTVFPVRSPFLFFFFPRLPSPWLVDFDYLTTQLIRVS